MTTDRRWGRPLLSLGSLAAAVAVAMVLLSPSAPGPVTAGATPSSSPSSAPTSAPLSAAEQYAESALRLIERHSLMLNDPMWAEVEHDTMTVVASARAPADTHPALFSALMRAAGPLAQFIPPEKVTPPSGAPPVAFTASGGVGHVVIVSTDELELTAASARAAQIADAIDAVRPKVSCGWVIDLRETMSPNDWGAVAGVTPFLDEGPLFGIEDRSDQILQVSAAMGSVFLHGRLLAASPQSTFRNKLPVAVLQSSGTAATGEGLLRGLIHTQNVRTFGRPVGSMPITESFSLSDGAQIVLPVARVVGDEGQSPEDRLSPMKATDKPDAEAVRWLRSLCQSS